MNFYLVAQMKGDDYHLVNANDLGLLQPGRRIMWLGSEHSLNTGTIAERIIPYEFRIVGDDWRKCEIPIERVHAIEMTEEEANKLFP
jgi:hypothetical protein